MDGPEGDCILLRIKSENRRFYKIGILRILYPLCRSPLPTVYISICQGYKRTSYKMNTRIHKLQRELYQSRRKTDIGKTPVGGGHKIFIPTELRIVDGPELSRYD